jgi:hypothetical protein
MDRISIAKIAGILIIVFFVLWFLGGIIWSITWWVIKMGVGVFVIYLVWQFFIKRFSS